MAKRAIDAILIEVRKFYAAGKKSGNKVYTVADFVAADEWEAHSRRWTVRMMAANLFRHRNRNQALSVANRPTPPNGQSLLAWGRGIYNGGARAEFTSGNCGEMAAVAGTIAVDTYGYPEARVYVGIISDPGDHVFCLLAITGAAPSWANASSMTGVVGNAGHYIIDPWLNTACAAEEYWGLAQEKVRKWGRDGKRISWNGPSGVGWYNPDGAYSQAFGAGPLSFYPVTTTF